MNAARKLILLVLVVMLTVQGCAGTLRCLDGGSHTSSASLVDDGDGGGGLQQTRGGDVRAVVYAVVGLAIIGAFIIDLFILPYSCYHRRHYFPLCSGLIHWCH